jgi:hypothetical protein
MRNHKERHTVNAVHEPAYNPDFLMSFSEVCQWLRISRKSLSRMIKQTPPVLSFVLVGPAGKTRKFRRAVIENYINVHTVKGRT